MPRWGGRRVVVTGANGFLGFHLSRRLLDLGAAVTAVVRPGANLWRLTSIAGDLDLVSAELADLPRKEVLSRLGDPDVVYHLAAAGTNQSVHEPEVVLQGNVVGIRRVLEAVRVLGGPRVVAAGTAFEYGAGSRLREDAPLRPLTVYAASKAAAHLLAHAEARMAGLSLVTLRAFSVYGPAQSALFLIPHTILSALSGSQIAVSGASQMRDYVFVNDAVDAFIKAADCGGDGEVYNICSGIETSVRDVVTLVIEATKSGRAATFRDAVSGHHELAVCSGSAEKARAGLGWCATTTLADGVGQTVSWFTQNAFLYERLAAQ